MWNQRNARIIFLNDVFQRFENFQCLNVIFSIYWINFQTFSVLPYRTCICLFAVNREKNCNDHLELKVDSLKCWQQVLQINQIHQIHSFEICAIWRFANILEKCSTFLNCIVNWMVCQRFSNSFEIYFMEHAKSSNFRNLTFCKHFEKFSVLTILMVFILSIHIVNCISKVFTLFWNLF